MPVLEEHRTLRAESDADETDPPPERLELEPVHDRELGVRSSVPGRRGVEEESRRKLGRTRDGLGRDLLLAEDCVGLPEHHILGPQLCVRARRDDDGRLSHGVHRNQRDPGRSVLHEPPLSDPGLA